MATTTDYLKGLTAWATVAGAELLWANPAVGRTHLTVRNRAAPAATYVTEGADGSTCAQAALTAAPALLALPAPSAAVTSSALASIDKAALAAVIAALAK